MSTVKICQNTEKCKAPILVQRIRSRLRGVHRSAMTHQLSPPLRGVLAPGRQGWSDFEQKNTLSKVPYGSIWAYMIQHVWWFKFFKLYVVKAYLPFLGAESKYTRGHRISHISSLRQTQTKARAFEATASMASGKLSILRAFYLEQRIIRER